MTAGDVVTAPHCGGIVPALAGCWQRGADTARPGVPADIEGPAKAVRRFHVDCLAHDAAVVDLAVSVFGEDRIARQRLAVPDGITGPGEPARPSRGGLRAPSGRGQRARPA